MLLWMPNVEIANTEWRFILATIGSLECEPRQAAMQDEIRKAIKSKAELPSRSRFKIPILECIAGIRGRLGTLEVIQ